MEIENSRIASLVTPNSGQGAPVEHQGKSTNPPATESGNSNSSSDRISLTGEARQLRELEASLASQPVVDNQRVAAVRSAIDDGTFKIDPQRIADKLMSLEEALTDAR